ncbi:MAG: hypothetical protein ACYDDF_01750 [Thermoplasmatota archaeon]
MTMIVAPFPHASLILALMILVLPGVTMADHSYNGLGGDEVVAACQPDGAPLLPVASGLGGYATNASGIGGACFSIAPAATRVFVTVSDQFSKNVDFALEFLPPNHGGAVTIISFFCGSTRGGAWSDAQGYVGIPAGYNGTLEVVVGQITHQGCGLEPATVGTINATFAA